MEIWQQASPIFVCVWVFLNGMKYVILLFYSEDILWIVEVFKKIQKS